MNLTIETRAPQPNVYVVDVIGEIDVYTSAQLKQDITALIADGAKYIVINLSKVEYLDSTGLGLLIGTLKRLRENDGNLLIVNPSQRIVRIFEITGLFKIFDIFDSEADAAQKEGLQL